MVHRLMLLVLSVVPLHAFVVHIPSKQNAAALSAAASSLPMPSPSSAFKEQLFSLLSNTPRNTPTPPRLTQQILEVVRQLEESCPTSDADVLTKLGGTWELVWTAQDASQAEANKLSSWINPLENQSYSNNPYGRYNPILPREAQDRLEKLGIINTKTSGSNSLSGPKSTQSIDLKTKQVQNVVSFGVGSKLRASLTLTIDFEPNRFDARRVDVQFRTCRIRLPNDTINIPLGIFGPRGWLRTVYVDDNLRITRGHKGSVFVLERPRKRQV